MSINISGIIFHIEEEGYSRLKDYFETINNYFSSYEDSSEIIADIESRVAEIFLSKLNNGKQIVNADDVNALIETMGTVADFEAIDDDEPVISETPNMESESAESEEGNTKRETSGKQRLLRDEKRKVIGGVASGIAYYFSIDPLWIRLVAVLLFLNVFVGAFSGAVFVLYIILWIVIPGSRELGDDEGVKKMFRNKENQVLGGVSSGIAAYFGTDVALIRLLFVLSIFLGGSGFILYVVLWIITPVANSITEKMQMQGEPLTLSNIEQSVKSSLSQKDGEESALAKTLLFPFRVIAAIFVALASLLGPISKVILEIARVIAGIAVAMAGALGMMSLFLASGVLMGLFTAFDDGYMMMNFPVDLLVESLSIFTLVAIFLISVVPFLLITLLGVSILKKRMVINAPLGWSIFGIWILCLLSLSFSIPSLINDFKNEATYKSTQIFDFDSEAIVNLKLDYVDFSNFDLTRLRLRGHEDSVFRLEMNQKSMGKTRVEAEENAQMIDYNVRKKENDLIFDSNYTFKKRAKFRGQELGMVLYIPYDQVFTLDDDMVEIIRNTININGYKNWDIQDNNQWVFTDSGLDCLTCETKRSSSRRGLRGADEYSSRRKSNRRNRPIEYQDDNAMSFDMEDFNQIEVQGIYNVFLSQGDEYSIEVKGRERFKKDVVIKKYGDVLEIDMARKKWDLLRDIDDYDRLDVFITLPNLEKVSSKGFGYLRIKEFEVLNLEIELSGASSADVDISAKELEIYLNGASTLEISGKTKYVEADLSGASTLKGYDLNAKSVEVSASGASNAKVYAIDKLAIEASGLSTVRYRGNAKANIIDENEFSTIRRSDD